MIQVLIGTRTENDQTIRQMKRAEKKHGRAVQYVAMLEEDVQVTLVKVVAAENNEATAGSDSRSSTSTATDGRTVLMAETDSEAGKSSSAC